MAELSQVLGDIASATRTAINNLTARVHNLEVKENSLASMGLFVSTYANLGTGLVGQYRHCSNARKGAEGAGLGTGCLVYWNTATSAWLKVYDNTAVTV